MAYRQSELTIITKAKELCSYVLTVTEKLLKRFCFTLVAKLQGYALESVECLYRANEVYAKTPQATEKRLDWQHQAITAFRLLGYMAQLAMEQQCVLPTQYEQITRGLYDCMNLTMAWINSDKKRTMV